MALGGYGLQFKAAQLSETFSTGQLSVKKLLPNKREKKSPFLQADIVSLVRGKKW